MYNIICEMNRQSRFDGLIQDAWGWCTGMTQRVGMGREVGGGSVWVTCVHPGGFMLMYGKTNTIIVK